MRRRDFVKSIAASAAIWPFAVRAQQPSKYPTVGFMSSAAADDELSRFAEFYKGLNESGFIEGRNVAIEYRWASGQLDRLPEMAADLVRRQVTVIAAVGAPNSPLAAKAATAIIPIVFTVGADPVRLGLVPNLNHPEGNATGIVFLVNELGAKRLSLLSDLIPNATVIGFLVDPSNRNAEAEVNDMQKAAAALGRTLIVFPASSASEIESAFASFLSQRCQALIVAAEAFFVTRRQQLAALAAQHSIPMMCHLREMVVAGGLVSYGTNLNDARHQAGVYVGRILKGEKPADLPVVQLTKFELVINLKTAKTLGLTIPPGVFAIADEVIE
jgi:putative tryptophan/tyrosine transport system substrate-binding protein